MYVPKAELEKDKEFRDIESPIGFKRFTSDYNSKGQL